MIIWFTGQPNSGKTTLAKELFYRLSCIPKNEKLCVKGCDCEHKSTIIPILNYVEHIDGDELRKLDNNNDYSLTGRRVNVAKAYTLANEYTHKCDYVIVSTVSPFRDQRESFKSNRNFKEIYLKSQRVREGKMVDYYEPPLENFLEIDTDKNTIEQSTKLIVNYVLQ